MPNRTVLPLTEAKPDFEDGFTSVRLIESYTRATASLYQNSPTIAATRFNIILVSQDRFKTQLWNFVRALRNLVRETLFHKREPPARRADILLFHSSRKPNVQPAMDLLATGLVNQKHTCAIISPEGLSYWTQEDKTPVSLSFIRAGAGLSASALFYLPFLAARDFLRIYSCLQNRSPALSRIVRQKALSVTAQLLLSRMRSNTADHLLASISPRVLITNGDHLDFAAELLLSHHAKRMHKINFFNENPLLAFRPFLSNEIWVWNQAVAQTFEDLAEFGDRPTYSITGRAEIDFVLPAHGDSTGRSVLDFVKDRKILVFLTEYDASPIWNTEAITREAVRWLTVAATNCPDWVIIYKTRPNHHGKPVPGIEFTKDVKNFLVLQEEISLGTMLAWKNTLAVTSLASTGLAVASGIGKSAFRLWISSRQSPIPPLDDVCAAVHDPRDLIQGLRKLDEASPVASYDSDEAFPFKSATVDRMTSLCLQRLTESLLKSKQPSQGRP